MLVGLAVLYRIGSEKAEDLKKVKSMRERVVEAEAEACLEYSRIANGRVVGVIGELGRQGSLIDAL